MVHSVHSSKPSTLIAQTNFPPLTGAEPTTISNNPFPTSPPRRPRLTRRAHRLIPPRRTPLQPLPPRSTRGPNIKRRERLVRRIWDIQFRLGGRDEGVCFMPPVADPAPGLDSSEFERREDCGGCCCRRLCRFRDGERGRR